MLFTLVMLVHHLTGIQRAPVTFKRGMCLPREYQNDEVSKGHDLID